MSRERFLVLLKEVNFFEKIFNIKALLKSYCYLENAMRRLTEDEIKIALADIDEKISVTNTNDLILNEQTRDVSNSVAGFVARKIKTTHQSLLQ